MYISGGENVYPAEVENVIYQLEEVAEAAVVGVADDRWGETGLAVIVVRHGSALCEDVVRKHCQGVLARFKQPKFIRFVPSLPRTASGKVQKIELRRLWADARARGDQAPIRP
jgi:fatty-acyl-CoA synthase